MHGALIILMLILALIQVIISSTFVIPTFSSDHVLVGTRLPAGGTKIRSRLGQLCATFLFSLALIPIFIYNRSVRSSKKIELYWVELNHV